MNYSRVPLSVLIIITLGLMFLVRLIGQSADAEVAPGYYAIPIVIVVGARLVMLVIEITILGPLNYRAHHYRVWRRRLRTYLPSTALLQPVFLLGVASVVILGTLSAGMAASISLSLWAVLTMMPILLSSSAALVVARDAATPEFDLLRVTPVRDLGRLYAGALGRYGTRLLIFHVFMVGIAIFIVIPILAAWESAFGDGTGGLTEPLADATDLVLLVVIIGVALGLWALAWLGLAWGVLLGLWLRNIWAAALAAVVTSLSTPLWGVLLVQTLPPTHGDAWDILLVGLWMVVPLSPLLVAGLLIDVAGRVHR